MTSWSVSASWLLIEHTYLVLTAEVAHAVVGSTCGPGDRARALVSGEEFQRASINGVVEPTSSTRRLTPPRARLSSPASRAG
ncbi:MAG: hypothetical protein ICV69_15855 [Thermoleophilaceae bacterium]|nr:hypothetical protein [Thermoleophilaceae bacterium]